MKFFVFLSIFCIVGLFADETLDSKLEALAQAKKQKVLDIVNKHKESVVSIQLVVKVPAMGNWERKLEIPGTVVSESGLIIVSNSQADPMVAMKRFSQQPGQETKTEFTDIKIILNDGKEIPAQIAMQDEDLDILIIKPKKEGHTFSYVTFDTEAAPKVLDEAIVIAKLDASTGREPLIFHGNIMAVITKPSKYYVIFGISSGVPAFDGNGKCFGLLLSRVGGGNANMNNTNNIASVMAMLPMILPAEEIVDVIADLQEEE